MQPSLDLLLAASKLNRPYTNARAAKPKRIRAMRLCNLLLLLSLPLWPIATMAQTGVIFVNGMVWRDYNHDGIRDPIEMNLGLPMVTMELWHAGTNTILQSTTPDAGGRYSFSLVATPLCRSASRSSIIVSFLI
jgi:hypothetical protein